MHSPAFTFTPLAARSATNSPFVGSSLAAKSPLMPGRVSGRRLLISRSASWKPAVTQPGIVTFFAAGLATGWAAGFAAWSNSADWEQPDARDTCAQGERDHHAGGSKCSKSAWCHRKVLRPPPRWSPSSAGGRTTSGRPHHGSVSPSRRISRLPEEFCPEGRPRRATKRTCPPLSVVAGGGARARTTASCRPPA